jgi:hypothetical protein
MKVILSGTEIPQYLSFRTLIAKVLGLVCAFAGGSYSVCCECCEGCE